jgi:hypothetical protein
VDVKDIEVAVTELAVTTIISISRKLDLELHLFLLHGLFAHRTGGTNARTTPRSIRMAAREFANLDCLTRALAKINFFHGLASQEAGETSEARRQGAWTPAASTRRLGGGQVESNTKRLHSPPGVTNAKRYEALDRMKQ